MPKDNSWELCEGRLLPLLKEFVGVNIVKTEERLVDDNTWSITLVEEPKLRISAYCCSKPKNSENICGDSFIFTDLGKWQIFIGTC